VNGIEGSVRGFGVRQKVSGRGGFPEGECSGGLRSGVLGDFVIWGGGAWNRFGWG
jgi:hypothetical protein